ncbi:MAG: hypothetical protein LBC70_08885 [Chitinispirillales bacterium]|nr:hypothetical protein [Chitinispirillales bacterium]
MAIFSKRVIRAARAAALAACAVGLTLPFAAGAESLSDRVDELSRSLDYLDQRVQSTLMSGGSSPISFSGEARLKMQYHNFGFDAPEFMQADRSYLQSGWEGNENLFRLGMIARPSRNTILYAKIGLQHTMTGNRSYRDMTPDEDGFLPYQYRNDKVQNSITIHEDLSAGIAVRTRPASFMISLGNTLWTEASPLTVWKDQPRIFAWEYLPFEVEQPIARYYEYKIARGEMTGPAAWNKRPFNGLNVESINLPLDLYANFVYGTFERFDNIEREFIDFGNDLGYADGMDVVFPEKSHGVGDSYRHLIHGRLAKSKMFGNMTLGLNYLGINYRDDVLYANVSGNPEVGLNSGTYLLLTEFRGYDTVFYKQPHVFSLDLRGPLSERFSIHADLAFGVLDTVKLIDPNEDRRTDYEGRAGSPMWYEDKAVSRTGFTPAAYLRLNYDPSQSSGWQHTDWRNFMPKEIDIAYIGEGFYSPFSFAVPMDGFFAFGANMVGAGKFAARGEGSPYTQNMTGVNLTFNPTLPGYGHFRVSYGQHMNITEDGRDLLFFPYRLHGADMFSFFHSSYNRWGNGLIDNSVQRGAGTYRGRLGDESFVHMTSWNSAAGGIDRVAGPGAGGLRSDFLSMYEGFVPYRNKEEAAINFLSRHSDAHFGRDPNVGFIEIDGRRYMSNLSTIANTNRALYFYAFDDHGPLIIDGQPQRDPETGLLIRDRDTLNNMVPYTTTSGWVPTSRKHTFNLELDAAYDIGSWVGYKNDLFIGGYVGFNGVSRSFTPLAFSADGDETLLYSTYVRFEPAVALRKNFYIIGLLGFENWRSNKSWMMVQKNGDGLVTGVNNPTSTGDESVGDRFSFTDFSNRFVQVPINSRDFAYGIGFDWDMLSRVGLHGRVKWMSHEDRGLNDQYEAWRVEGLREDGTSVFNPQAAGNNDWNTWVVSFEVKTWF